MGKHDIEALSFEDAFALLNETVSRLEEGSLGLEESLALFEKGMQIVARCNALLDSAELRISQLVPTADEGFRLVSLVEDME